MTYHKILYGYHIDSDIDLPYLLDYKGQEAKGPIVIRKGEVPDEIEDPIHLKKWLTLSETEFITTIPKIGRFHIKKQGTSIHFIYMKHDGVSKHDLASTFIGSLLIAGIYYNNEIALHAGSLNLHGHTIMIAGHSGAGKSSTLSGLMRTNAKLLTDDICFFQDKALEDELRIHHGHPNIRLWQDSIEYFDLHQNVSSRINYYTDKFWIAAEDQFENKSNPVSHLFILSSEHTPNITIEELHGIRKFQAIKKHVSLKFIVSSLNNKDLLFKFVSSLSNNLRTYKISRPTGFHTNAIVDHIMEIVKAYDKN